MKEDTFEVGCIGWLILAMMFSSVAYKAYDLDLATVMLSGMTAFVVPLSLYIFWQAWREWRG